ncbi:MAG TPA: hypothetical protein P5572_12205 [Phycisphaerae bacterium]|nr:hypothetical protein [Phycisphaerae bacterium]
MEALQALMAGIVDYAGLFPPARLAMQPVVANYAKYRAGPQRAMLGRVICPTQRFDEFADCAGAALATGADGPWLVSALGRGGDDAANFLEGVAADVAALRALTERFEGRVQVDAYECRLPHAVVERCKPEGLAELAGAVAQRVDADAPGLLTPYYEVPFVAFAGDWRRDVPPAIAGLAQHNRSQARGGRCQPGAVKIRTGGVEAGAFPSVEQVTAFIRWCADERIAFKATAGLHHPVRHYAALVQTKMHGFLNVFGAAVLTWAHDLDAATIACIVEDEEAKHFRCDAGGFHWQERFTATVEEIGAARRAFAHGFGSCSFDEPVEDLRALGMLRG